MPKSLGLPCFLLLVLTMPALSGTAMCETPAVKSMAAVVQPYVDKHLIAGAVTLVADKDRVLALEAAGYADLATKKPMQTDSLFWVASQSKPICAVAVLILVDEGRLQLDEPVEKYLPEFKGQMVIADRDEQHVLLRRPQHPITIRNTLTHTTGLPYKSPIEEPSLDLFPLDTRVKSYAMLPLAFEPDTKYLYSSAGINTAARIVEVVSGMPYDEFLDKRIFQPLGMKDTTFWPTPGQLQRLAKSYKPVPGGLEEFPILKLRYPLDDRGRRPVPGAGLFSTATDLSIFYRMLAHQGIFAGRRIISEQAVREMIRVQFPAAKPNYGLAIETTGKLIGHGGSYNTHSRLDCEHQLITVFLTQEVEFPKDARNIVEVFRKAATAAFAKPAR
jgi:CubicO group peptidase (beta-lactamase class C family)